MHDQENELNQGELLLGQPAMQITPQAFLPLILEVMNRENIKNAELVRRTGLGTSKISRMLSQKRSLDNGTMYAVFAALKIDPMRALLAVGRFGEWEQYFDPDVEIIADLIDVLPNYLSKARTESPRISISKPGAGVLAEKLSEMIAKNDRETQRRQLERPIAGI